MNNVQLPITVLNIVQYMLAEAVTAFTQRIRRRSAGMTLARRNDHAPDELRTLAIEAAGVIAGEEGLRGLTVRRVAERIGYAPGTLYNLFSNLDDLIVQLNGVTLSRLEQALREAAGGPSGRPTRMVDAYFDFVERDPRLWALLFEHRLPKGATLPDWYQARLDSLVYFVASVLEPEMGGWSDTARRKAVVAMWAALHGIATLSVSSKLALVDDSTPRSLAYLVVDSILSQGMKDFDERIIEKPRSSFQD